jgi:hypothetical protein
LTRQQGLLIIPYYTETNPQFSNLAVRTVVISTRAADFSSTSFGTGLLFSDTREKKYEIRKEKTG